VRLSNRLSTIQSIAEHAHKQYNYDYIWDTCCDHGQLGAGLLKNGISSKLFFVDIVPELMASLEQNLNQFFPNQKHQWRVLCEDVSCLHLNGVENPSGKHLIIIAGVGGDLMLEFITQLNQQFPDLSLDFLLCPVHHQFSLRSQLRKMEFSLRHEEVLEDNQRFYEVLLVTSDSTNQLPLISVAGETFWQYKTVSEQKVLERYLSKTIEHYKRMQKGNSKLADSALVAYESVKIEKASLQFTSK